MAGPHNLRVACVSPCSNSLRSQRPHRKLTGGNDAARSAECRVAGLCLGVRVYMFTVRLHPVFPNKRDAVLQAWSDRVIHSLRQYTHTQQSVCVCVVCVIHLYVCMFIVRACVRAQEKVMQHAAQQREKEEEFRQMEENLRRCVFCLMTCLRQVGIRRLGGLKWRDCRVSAFVCV